MRKTIILGFLAAGLAVCAVFTDLARAYAADVSLSPSTFVQSLAIWLAR
jgi:hypothetical protein